MKPPVNIDDLLEEWVKDAVIDETEPMKALLKISSIHAKYLRILTHHNLIIKKLTIDYNKLKNIKVSYYSGDLNNPEDLKEYGFEPMMKKLEHKSHLAIYLDGDNDLNTILIKRVIHQEIVDTCDMILKEINNRTYQLSNIVKWELYLKGDK